MYTFTRGPSRITAQARSAYDHHCENIEDMRERARSLTQSIQEGEEPAPQPQRPVFHALQVAQEHLKKFKQEQELQEQSDQQEQQKDGGKQRDQDKQESSKKQSQLSRKFNQEQRHKQKQERIKQQQCNDMLGGLQEPKSQLRQEIQVEIKSQQKQSQKQLRKQFKTVEYNKNDQALFGKSGKEATDGQVKKWLQPQSQQQLQPESQQQLQLLSQSQQQLEQQVQPQSQQQQQQKPQQKQQQMQYPQKQRKKRRQSAKLQQQQQQQIEQDDVELSLTVSLPALLKTQQIKMMPPLTPHDFELIRFLHDSWVCLIQKVKSRPADPNVKPPVKQRRRRRYMRKDVKTVAPIDPLDDIKASDWSDVLYCDEPASPLLDNFKPLDLDEWWKNRIFENVTQNI